MQAEISRTRTRHHCIPDRCPARISRTHRWRGRVRARRRQGHRCRASSTCCWTRSTRPAVGVRLRGGTMPYTQPANTPSSTTKVLPTTLTQRSTRTTPMLVFLQQTESFCTIALSTRPKRLFVSRQRSSRSLLPMMTTVASSSRKV